MIGNGIFSKLLTRLRTKSKILKTWEVLVSLHKCPFQRKISERKCRERERERERERGREGERERERELDRERDRDRKKSGGNA